jgi:hypothetical protein
MMGGVVAAIGNGVLVVFSQCCLTMHTCWWLFPSACCFPASIMVLALALVAAVPWLPMAGRRRNSSCTYAATCACCSSQLQAAINSYDAYLHLQVELDIQPDEVDGGGDDDGGAPPDRSLLFTSTHKEVGVGLTMRGQAS